MYTISRGCVLFVYILQEILNKHSERIREVRNLASNCGERSENKWHRIELEDEILIGGRRDHPTEQAGATEHTGEHCAPCRQS